MTEALSTFVAGIKRASLLFIGTVGVGGNVDDGVNGVTAGVTEVDKVDVEYVNGTEW
jgi:hypothetical protein